jgi:hypothetical protein
MGLHLQLQVLPDSQRQLWQQLSSTPPDFVLYGGTALALRLGHRPSVDFDFFSCRAFQPMELIRSVPYLHDQSVTQLAENTLTCEVLMAGGAVKVSFFGDLSLGQIDPPDRVPDVGIAIASLRDLFATKCATVLQRNETKDYLDIHALITRAKIDLAEGIACAQAIYARQYNPLLTLQALCYFDDLSSPLSAQMQSDLLAAVRKVSLDRLPEVKASNSIGSASFTPP